MTQSAELSIGRDPDGEVNLEIYIDAENQVSLSISRAGRISWAAQAGGGSLHGTTESALGNVMFHLIDKCVATG